MKILVFFYLIIGSINCHANNGNGEIFVNLQKLHSLKRVLYVAAHPDDENTRALAWFSLGEKAETAYFSLTRGDGGQNLIGNELSEELGILRTQELLAARSHDGAKQYFSRAVDFGYSKSAEESFELWGKDILLSDLVLVIRKFKPDVIVTRFPPDERAGHGHHTASALLAIEAFKKAADVSYSPGQVAEFGTWQATSIYWNTSYWWDENIKDLTEGDPNYLITDIGGYNAQLGMSYNEIGTLARSEHKCQGFGGIINRGSRTEYFKHLEGEKLKNSFFEKSERTWTSIGDKQLELDFKSALDNFDFIKVSNNVPLLLKILKRLKQLPPSYILDEKIMRCETIIQDCLGLYVEVLGDQFSFIKGDSLALKANLINRSTLNIQLKKIEMSTGESLDFDDTLLYNNNLAIDLLSSGSAPISNPYWLNEPFSNVFKVKDSRNLCAPESPSSIVIQFTLSVVDEEFTLSVPASYKWRDPSYGERRRPLISTPSYSASFEQKQLLMKPGEQKEVRVKVKSFKDSLNTNLNILAPDGWQVSPKNIVIDLKEMHAEEWFVFTVEANKDAKPGSITLSKADGTKLFSYKEIVYDHIPTQSLFRTASLKCTAIDAQINKGRVAYIKGVDDAVPQAIKQLGFELDFFEVKDIPSIDFSKYNSVVLGIRIYNAHPELSNYRERLNAYVKNGGNLVMQYNTASRSIKGKEFGPYPFELSRNRVTEEDAEVTFLAPDHQIMNTPNKITKSDFDHWVQERGLYFADNWNKEFTPLFSWADEGEEAQKGALIVAKYGKGQFVYSGISFFRELPNGVVGAYRLFANILSYQP
ncbi:MAG: PIG-L family deacetylase [Flavobacteriales bacterium]|nr:PIG-L family deacetylase [Flavobacteriales bacterium]